MKKFLCPLCGCKEYQESWIRLSFLEHQFDYLQCLGCRSLICEPMPDEKMLGRMYDSAYSEDFGKDKALEKFSDVIDYLKTLNKGLFIDYGCGDGQLLKKVRSMGWDVLGIEFNPDFAAELKKDGIKVISYLDTPPFQADVLHLGDVIEHLTDLDNQFPQILELLKDDGYLVAHGPLEGNPNLFFQMLKIGKIFKRSKITNMAPFHVILATSKGQLDLFERNKLKKEIFQVDEVAFPAVEHISFGDLGDIRKAGLFLIRKASQITSTINMKNLGNRYFYVGKR